MISRSAIFFALFGTLLVQGLAYPSSVYLQGQDAHRAQLLAHQQQYHQHMSRVREHQENALRFIASGTSAVHQPRWPQQFSCVGKSFGYYADILSGCQKFHICQPSSNSPVGPSSEFAPQHPLQTTYSCPNETYFNQQTLSCSHLDQMTTSCADQERFFNVNDQLSSNSNNAAALESSSVNSYPETVAPNEPEIISPAIYNWSPSTEENNKPVAALPEVSSYSNNNRPSGPRNIVNHRSFVHSSSPVAPQSANSFNIHPVIYPGQPSILPGYLSSSSAHVLQPINGPVVNPNVVPAPVVPGANILPESLSSSSAHVPQPVNEPIANTNVASTPVVSSALAASTDSSIHLESNAVTPSSEYNVIDLSEDVPPPSPTSDVVASAVAENASLDTDSDLVHLISIGLYPPPSISNQPPTPAEVQPTHHAQPAVVSGARPVSPNFRARRFRS